MVAMLCSFQPELRERVARRVAVRAAPNTAADAFLARNVVTNLKLAGNRQGLELHVDRTIVVHEGDADAVPVALLVSLGDDVHDFHLARIHVTPLASSVENTDCGRPPGVGCVRAAAHGSNSSCVPGSIRGIFGICLERALANASLAGGDRHSRAPLTIQGFARGDFTCYVG
jgi:hypothetical protein